MTPNLDAESLPPNVDGHRATSLHGAPWMAGIAQLVERQVVVLDVTGSSPVARPTVLMPAARKADRHARGVGGASEHASEEAAREIRSMPAARLSTDRPGLRAADISPS